MYYYYVEKNLPSDYNAKDITLLNDLILNEETVHRYIGKLFGVNGQENWRSTHNILYKKVPGAICKLLVQSDKEIDLNAAKALSFNVTSLTPKAIQNGQKVTVNLIAFPAMKVDGSKNRTILRDRQERLDWVIRKLTSNGECQVDLLKETESKSVNMAHQDQTKGAGILYGYEYEGTLTVKDAKGFNTLIRNGIGTCKNYGFGMLEIVA